MIYGIGIDIVEIERVRKVYNKYGEKFKRRCFLESEIKRSENKLKTLESYAKRYAAKEACAKALGTGLARGVFWKDIEIRNNKYGKPYILLHNNALRFLKMKKINNINVELSISDEVKYAIANVILYK